MKPLLSPKPIRVEPEIRGPLLSPKSSESHANSVRGKDGRREGGRDRARAEREGERDFIICLRWACRARPRERERVCVRARERVRETDEKRVIESDVGGVGKRCRGGGM